MGLFDAIQRLRTNVHNDVLAPIQRGIVGAVEAVNPWDAESRGNNLINSASAHYGFSPYFKSILDRANPVVSNNPFHSSLLSNNATAVGLTYTGPGQGYRQHHIDITGGPSNRNPQQTLLHEGLNTVWEHMSPQEQSSFLNLAQSTLPGVTNQVPRGWHYGDIGNGVNGWRDPQGKPGILPQDARSWLTDRYSSYREAPSNFNDLTKLPRNIGREVLPYLADYYDSTNQPMPKPIADFYSRYYNTNQRVEASKVLDSINQLLHF